MATFKTDEERTVAEAVRYALERAVRDGADMRIWRVVLPTEVRIAVRHHESGEPWIAGARAVHIKTVTPGGDVREA